MPCKRKKSRKGGFNWKRRMGTHITSVPKTVHRRPFPVVAAWVPLAQQVTKRSRPVTDEASKYIGASSKSMPHAKKFSRPFLNLNLNLLPRTQKSSRAGFSATAKELTSYLSWRKDESRCQRPESRPGIGRPIAFLRFHPGDQSRGIQKSPKPKRQIRKNTVRCHKEHSRMHRRHLDATSPTIPMHKHRETDCSRY